MNTQDSRIKFGWESRRGERLVIAPVEKPFFENHPRFARAFSKSIILFALRVFTNGESEFYDEANSAIVKNCRFYIENIDVRDDRDSFYWNISELCRVIIYYGSKGTKTKNLLSKDAENFFLKMAYGYCHDNSKLEDADYIETKTWHIYESENHHVQRNSAIWQMLFILLKYDDYRDKNMADGFSVKEHFEAWNRFFKVWISERGRKSLFIESQSKCYALHTLKNIYTIYDFTEDEKLKRLSENIINLFWAVWAQEQINGNQGGAQARVYPPEGRSTLSEIKRWAWYYAGVGEFIKPDTIDYTMIDSKYRMPEMIVNLINQHEKRGVYEIEMRPLGLATDKDIPCDYRPETDWGGIYRYTYCTPDFVMGTFMFDQLPSNKWCLISSQNRYQGVTFGEEENMMISLAPKPGLMLGLDSEEPTVAFNTFWSMQKFGTILTQKCKYAEDSGKMNIWFAHSGNLDSIEKEDNWYFTKSTKCFIAVCVVKGEAMLSSYCENYLAEVSGKFLICDDEFTPVILECVQSEMFESFDAFKTKILSQKIEVKENILKYKSVYGTEFNMYTDGKNKSTIDGEYYVKKTPFSIKSPFVSGLWNENAEIRFNSDKIELDFNTNLLEG